MKRCLLALFSITLLAWTAPAGADWFPGQPAKWVQMPDLSTNGIDVNATDPFLLADDFLCTQTGPITGIHIWGSWRQDALPFGQDPTSVRFILSIHQDIPADQSPTGYSMPGEVLWWRTFDPGLFTVQVWEDTLREGWLDPPQNYQFPGDTICWQYNFDISIDEAFVQQGSSANPIVYWLDVKAIPLDDTTRFGWKTTQDHWNDDAVWATGPEPYLGTWEELRYPPQHEQAGQSMDLAFVISGEQQQVDLDWGDAPDSNTVAGYPTLAIHNGANHVLSPNGPWLGNAADFPDAEPDGQPTPGASGDDTNGIDDENGVLIPPLVQGQVANIQITVNGPGGFVTGWIDYNHNQSWLDAGEQIVAANLAPGNHAINVNVPAAASLGVTYARFRIDSAVLLPPDGPASDGEVEDYRVRIEPQQTYKWEQAPDLESTGIDVDASYDFLLADDYLCTQTGPITRIDIWGSWLDDHLPFGQDPNGLDFMLSFHRDIPAQESPTGYSMPGETLWVQTFTPGTYTASVWANNLDEGWLDPPDQYIFPGDHTCWRYSFIIPEADAFVQQGSPTDSVVYWLDVQALPFDTGARFGWKTSQEHWNDDAVWTHGGEPYNGLWNELHYPPQHPFGGDSIDLAFRLQGQVSEQLDFGDAPDPTYPTLLASNGARHTIVPGVLLGTAIDGEPDGQPVPAGLGDDSNGVDDEDGVVFGVLALRPGALTNVTVTASVAGRLDAWIDYHGDGSWATPGDQVFASQPLVAGANNLTFTVPPTGMPGHLTFARFRFSSAGGLSYTGPAPDGEVEDYMIRVEDDVTGVPGDATPQGFQLYPCTPNPFNPTTTIRFDLPTAHQVDLSIYTIEGRRIATLVHEMVPAGSHEVVWDGRDATGQRVASGTYFCHIAAGPYETTERMTLVK